MELAAYMEDVRHQVEGFLKNHFQFPVTGTATKLYEAMRYSLLAGGKRIRPVLVMASFEASFPDLENPRKEAALRVAAALEMIHTYSLIHDDLPAMDNDDLRRGMPTNHKAYGEATAILAGDSLLTEAFRVVARAGGVEASVLLDVMGDIAEASGAQGMAGGQSLDLESEKKILGLEELETLHRHKTGCLIEVSVTSGAKLAGANSEKIKKLKTYGEKIGLAFQIADDVLDVEGLGQEMGKGTGGDARKEKATYPSLLGLEKSKLMADELSQEAIDTLYGFDGRADPLRKLAKYIVNRKS